MTQQKQARYFLYNRNTQARTGEYKAVKNVNTREEAREAKRNSTQDLGIYDRWSSSPTH